MLNIYIIYILHCTVFHNQSWKHCTAKKPSNSYCRKSVKGDIIRTLKIIWMTPFIPGRVRDRESMLLTYYLLHMTLKMFSVFWFLDISGSELICIFVVGSLFFETYFIWRLTLKWVINCSVTSTLNYVCWTMERALSRFLKKSSYK